MTAAAGTARSPARYAAGLGLGLAGMVAISAIPRGAGALTNAALLYLVPVVTVAALCGVWLGTAAAVASTLVLNWFFVPPYHTLSVQNHDYALALVVYVLVALVVSIALHLAARQRARAQRLAEQAAQAQRLAEIDRLRTAILAAVGHDLRTPLAGIKAAASSLRAGDVAFSAADTDELLATIVTSTDLLDDLVENLLALSRLQAGVLSAHNRPVALDEVVARALLHSPRGAPVEVRVAEDLPRVLADPGLLERVVAYLVGNAVRLGAGTPVTVDAQVTGAVVRLRVVDHGPGIPAADRTVVFEPFQRLGDRTGGGLGLGLAIARGFTTAMGGTISPTDTPGGGLTMTVALPAVPEANRTGP